MNRWYQIDKFGFQTEVVCANGGYDNCEVYDAMFKREIKTFIPRRAKPVSRANYEEGFSSDKFIYNEKGMHISVWQEKNSNIQHSVRKTERNNIVLK